MHDRIANSELMIVENGTHPSPIERPMEVTQAIVEFLARRKFASERR